MSRALADNSDNVSYLSICHLYLLKKFLVVWWGTVITVSALSLSPRDKEKLRDIYRESLTITNIRPF